MPASQVEADAALMYKEEYTPSAVCYDARVSHLNMEVRAVAFENCESWSATTTWLAVSDLLGDATQVRPH